MTNFILVLNMTEEPVDRRLLASNRKSLRGWEALNIPPELFLIDAFEEGTGPQLGMLFRSAVYFSYLLLVL